jgi:hypothetical protein
MASPKYAGPRGPSKLALSSCYADVETETQLYRTAHQQLTMDKQQVDLAPGAPVPRPCLLVIGLV